TPMVLTASIENTTSIAPSGPPTYSHGWVGSWVSGGPSNTATIPTTTYSTLVPETKLTNPVDSGLPEISLTRPLKAPCRASPAPMATTNGTSHHASTARSRPNWATAI